MPLDGTGAPAPRPLSSWVEHLKRRRIAGKKARSTIKRRRAITEQRIAKAERLLADIIAGADIIGHDAEPDHDNEPSIGVDTADLDPIDLGEQLDYTRSQDGAIVAAARERFDPRKLGSSHPMGPNLIFRTVDPETKRAGMWVLQRKAGAR